MTFNEMYSAHFREIVFAREILLIVITIYLFSVRNKKPSNRYYFWGFLFITIAATFPFLQTFASVFPVQMFGTYVIAVPFLALALICIVKAEITKHRERQNTIRNN